MISRLSVSLLLVCCVGGVSAQTTQPCATEDHHAFDFWLGQWQVHSKDGQLAGRNHIQSAEGGCLLIERWQGQNGASGQSYNYFDRTDQQWHQLWVSPGVVIDISGTRQGQQMQLSGEIRYQQAGNKLPFRGTWTLREDGAVVQFFEQFNPTESRWDEWFTGIYTKPKPELPTQE
ncbi:MAG: hypothetical protein AAF529_05125 [Pseudomonadota bacterium]